MLGGFGAQLAARKIVNAGVPSVITMVEIGRGSSTAIQHTIASMGANVVNIDPSDAVKSSVSAIVNGELCGRALECESCQRRKQLLNLAP